MRPQFLLEPFGVLLPQIRIDPTRANRIHQDIVLAELGRQRLGEIEQRGVGHAAAEHVRVRLFSGAADRVDDAAPLLRLHHRIDQTDGAHETEQLRLELVLHFIVVEDREAAGIHRAGIVDENIDAAELSSRGFDQAPDIVLFCHVGLDRVHFTAGLVRKLVTRLVDLFGGAAGYHHAGPFLKKQPCGLVTDPAAAAGDNRAATLDPQIHFSRCPSVSLTHEIGP